jgi:hypothetical protein
VSDVREAEKKVGCVMEFVFFPKSIEAIVGFK